ncbi:MULTISPECIES: styrene monooxygenase/indole monooxygenase family protein [Pandoraea]|uniref:styrene monooxygenase/indole monooxygenase family protein n=1 Tax=Pandoraea TaxID=93217 RepID=UPI000847BADB|nr:MULTISPECIES: styrene monooxygenase/indole monooxygenase family protein [Pandoraea]MCI3205270.1 oxidoreductase [Pandoraea sp. LA3]MDN4583298.1 oxidoreductase [Pandoraea capi]ODP34398.1 hypothetical protein A9762_15625 [Pandoraea sp. ISTKB]
MKKIAIIGAGPAGCILAYALLKSNYDVTLYSDRSPDQWLNHSKPTGSAYLYDEVIEIERSLGMDHWSDKSFRGHGFLLDTLATVGGPRTAVQGRTEYGRRGAAIDQRMRVSRWLEDLESRGGKLVIESVTLERMDEIAATHDLTVLAAGKADLAACIPRHAERAVYDRPQRNLAMAVVQSKSGKHTEWFSDRVPYVPVKFNQYGDVGEYFWVPYEHKTAGASFAILLEARPGGMMDRFGDCKTGQDVVKAACDIIRDTAPWEAHIADDMTYVEGDPHAWLVGRFSPTVRQAFAKMPSGGYVIPVGDTAITFDPVCGQGGQFANRSANFLAEVIVARGEHPVTEQWLTQINDDLWENYGRAAYKFNHHFLEPFDSAGASVIATAAQNLDAGDALFNGFARPDRMLDTLLCPQQAQAFVERYQA